MRAKGLTGALALAGAVLLSLAVATGAWAQTMFYQEVQKNGRIYVFALMKEFDAFDKSGEMGKSITRLGYGPAGETVVFDSEDAINYYNFKHDKPGEVFLKPAEPPKPREEAFVKVGVTIFADYIYQDAPQITDTDKNAVNLSSFEIRRAYINVTGNISDWVSYRITPDVGARLATTAASTNLDGSALFRLKYAFGQVNFDKVATHGTWVRIGQQQTPFFDFADGIYRYRFQGTIFEEREGYLSSSDVGISGRFVFPRDYGEVHVGYYNGDTYTKAETNDQKAFQIRGTLRPFPKSDTFKGLRLTAFYDHDSPIRNGARGRFIAMGTFEHKYLNLGLDYLEARDQSSPAKARVKSSGWTVWATPRTLAGFEAIVRYDHLKPNTSVDAVKSRILGGLSYWLKVKSPLAAAVLVDYEKVNYDTLLAKANEKRFEIKTLFTF